MGRPPSNLAAATPSAVPLYLRLLDALDLDGDPVPCRRGEGALWTSEDYRDRDEAVQACRWCPARGPCGEYADAQNEPAHIWAGTDRTTSKRKKEP